MWGNLNLTVTKKQKRQDLTQGTIDIFFILKPTITIDPLALLTKDNTNKNEQLNWT